MVFRLFKQDTIDRWFSIMETRRVFTVKISYQDYAQARRNFCAYEQKRRVPNRRSWEDYVRGCYGYYDNGQIYFTEEMGRKIRLLCSPHYHALLKASAHQEASQKNPKYSRGEG